MAGMARSVHNSSNYQNLCRMLIEERRSRGLTQIDVARMLKRPQSFVSKYESGERRITVIDFMEIAHAIGFDAGKFIRKFEVGFQ